MLSAVLAVAAVAAGLTGAWSPCGFSMVETLAPHGYAGRLRTTLVACATFSVGAVAGGVATFGGLAVLGETLGAGGPAALAAAALVALGAAVGEARGVRIVPQVRRQVPESWRRVLPLALAAGLYGILLGLGFTTFILSFAVWALAAVCVAVGDPALGVLVGVAFGLGRALPVVVLAPGGEDGRGALAAAAMAERPAILRGLRRIDAVALLACAAALGAAPASAQAPAAPVPAPPNAEPPSAVGAVGTASVLATGAADPSVEGAAIAVHRPGRGGLILTAGAAPSVVPGTHPALGGGRTAWLEEETIVVTVPGTRETALRVPAPRADAVAVSADWLVWRAPRGSSGDVLYARALDRPDRTTRRVAATRAPRELGRPALAGAFLAYHVASAKRSSLAGVDLATGSRRTLRSERGALLSNPSLLGDELLYVRSNAVRQELRLGLRNPGLLESTDRILYATAPTARRDAGYEPGRSGRQHSRPQEGRLLAPANRRETLWTTALGDEALFVTRLRQRTGGATTASVLRVGR